MEAPSVEKEVEYVSVMDVAAWLRQEARGIVTPLVRKVLVRLAKQAETGMAPIGEQP
jgi:hypothetical protein